ncbi:alkylhydroperoxidase [Pseudomonas gingeri NCPPB 3146 = LMG 5327]|uniref:Carboxymuconolactone decarboxylase family protein n=3 Tax=Pseudomonas gingeri TaxID=117681 RepID=A0A7Y7XW51_9PSED|nr:carboxymuconolactone decarboxylase family protein [Pseudomonas gingeri]NVZ24766.1 carboxymuconolactone decarboxylase family protein [Pseudomonas gingeri]NWA05625.1 carboxymuconolactone decarboxylase family protein [Pseudomonas gingeri]NWC13204.1 carboxymuconolactone decarboxylase family protein [Pseudomonas gingeri]PNQ92652.1 alkylhydroperoxidase [Pseudomonas gingeri NCPPB 3146 = LMG 5327]
MEPRLDFYTASPQALKGLLLLEEATFGLSIEKPLLDLVKLRVSQLNHCAFCADLHSQEARGGGESERRLYGISAWRDSPLYSAREQAALAWSEALTLLAHDPVSDELYAQARLQFSERELVDLSMAIAAINCWNRLAVAFRQPLAV